MNLGPGEVVDGGSESPQPNLQEVLFVMGGRSLDDSDDEDEDEDRDPRLLPRNCGFYNTKTSKPTLCLIHDWCCLFTNRQETHCYLK